jgi:exopolysaccharide biosynthesis WecB/TagA/CpsF family protein
VIAFPAGNGSSVCVNASSGRELLAKIENDLSLRKSFTVATLNLDHLVKLRRCPEFRQAYLRQTHVVADGNPVVWLSRLARDPVELAPGSELIGPLAALAARLDAPVALLGSTERTLALAAARLEAEHPGLRIVARIAPPFGLDPEGPEAAACLDAVARSGARLCLLALGAPKQEVLAARGVDRAPGCGFVSVGAGLDFIAGTQRRAPAWVRAIAMEWLWRMLSDPRRLLRRYVGCALILPGLVLHAAKARRATGGLLAPMTHSPQQAAATASGGVILDGRGRGSAAIG